MSTLPALPLDHVALGLSRVIKQYQNSPKFLAYVAALLEQNQTCETLLQSMYQLPSIPNMTGVNLDVIGRIVGITRNIPDGIQLVFFGFSGFSDQTVFGELDQPGIGSRMYDIGDPTTATTVLPDQEYRLLLYAKIAKNSSKATGEDIENILAFIFGVDQVNVDDFGGMVIGLAIGRELTQIEQAILTQIDLLPRPACVLIGSVTTFIAGDYFGFSDLSGLVIQPGALGFGELEPYSPYGEGPYGEGPYGGGDGSVVGGGILANLFVPLLSSESLEFDTDLDVAAEVSTS